MKNRSILQQPAPNVSGRNMVHRPGQEQFLDTRELTRLTLELIPLLALFGGGGGYEDVLARTHSEKHQGRN